MHFDRFDICEAYYLWLTLHHDGKGYKKSDPRYWSSYGRLSTMQNALGYRPSALLAYETLTENGQAIYDNLCLRGGWCDCQKDDAAA